MEVSFDAQTLYAFLGFFVVLFFAVNYFNEPEYPFAEDDVADRDESERLLEPALPKFMTTRYYFNLYRFTFVLVAEAGYVLLAFLLPYLTEKGEFSGMAAKSNPMASALIIAGAIPNLPYVKNLLDRAKRFLHEKAQIPSTGRDVYATLQRPNIRYSDHVIQKILDDEQYASYAGNQRKTRKDLEAGDFCCGHTSIEGKWSKLSYLLFHVNEWSRKSPYKNYLYNNSELRWTSIKRSYRLAYTQMVRYKANELSPDEKTTLNHNLEALLKTTYRLISCLLFITDKSSCAFNRHLGELGYFTDIGAHFAIPTRKMVIAAFAAVFSIIVGAALSGVVSWVLKNGLGYFDGAQITTNDVIKWTAYGVPFLMLPVLFVLGVKRHYSFGEDWPVATPSRNRYLRISDRPWFIYFIVTVLSYVVAALTLVFLLALHNLLIRKTIELPLRTIFTWSLVPMVTAAFAVYRIDSISDKQNRFLRILTRTGGALVQGITTSLVIYLILMHLENEGRLAFSFLQSELLGKTVIFMTMGFVIGFMLFLTTGFNPTVTRCSPRYSAKAPVSVRVGENDYKGELQNISREGSLISVPGLNSDPGMEVRFTLGDNRVIAGRTVSSENDFARLRTNAANAWDNIRAFLRLQTD